MGVRCMGHRVEQNPGLLRGEGYIWRPLMWVVRAWEVQLLVCWGGRS